MLVSGLLLGALFYVLFPSLIIAYISMSLGGIISGYLYTVKTCHYLNKYKIIREIVPWIYILILIFVNLNTKHFNLYKILAHIYKVKC